MSQRGPTGVLWQLSTFVRSRWVLPGDLVMPNNFIGDVRDQAVLKCIAGVA